MKFNKNFLIHKFDIICHNFHSGKKKTKITTKNKKKKENYGI